MHLAFFALIEKNNEFNGFEAYHSANAWKAILEHWNKMEKSLTHRKHQMHDHMECNECN